MAIHNPLTGYEPKQLDNFDLIRDFCSDLPERIRRHRHGTVVLVRCGTRRWACRKSAIFTTVHSTREEPANPRHTVCCQLSPFSHTSTERLVYEPSSSQKRKSSRDLEDERIRILLERQTEQILAEVRSEIQKHELQTASDRRSTQEFTGTIDSQRMEIDHTITGCDQPRRDQLLLQEAQSAQNRALRETCVEICETWKKCRKVTC